MDSPCVCHADTETVMQWIYQVWHHSTCSKSHWLHDVT